MQQHIGKLLPAHGYFILSEQQLNQAHMQALMQLYQPLLGVQAVSLYLTLSSQSNTLSDQKVPQTHHMLMQYLNIPLPDIYQARQKLEGIGLMQTFQYDDADQTIFTYKLLLPCTPIEFFQDGLLSQLLYHQLGANKCDQLYQLFKQNEPNYDKGRNVTAHFPEVFKNELNITEEFRHSESSTSKNDGPTIGNETIDLNGITQILTQRMLPAEKILTATNIRLIEQMSALYNLTNLEIEKALLWAISDENRLNHKEFKTACMDLSQSMQPQSKTKVNAVDQKATYSKKMEEPKNKQEQFIQMLEEITPRQLLADLSNGNQASTQDLKIVADVMTQQGITPGVMNVLIHYVLLKTDMKLTKSYLEKIASHWARKNVKTVRQAMTLAKSEHNKYQQWGNNKKTYNRSAGKKEVVPDWFKKQKQAQATKEKQIVTKDSESKEDVSELLRKYNEQKFNHS
ncbi:replication initiation and membrane attachment protein [Paraliobacillus quinghaiensis]|uniref:Replication initiation and membrane attachment protein n=1 Tax=Paraliobacillus quinghaiensis TaxID=470815 RepID=A0A917WTI4_9BACI|nr:DnaD domain protein [Paraliobacillus quinghaiensis]GGM26760.1 replication initiation and membrane attachment protein [Paraliobacillus quinghaiensis]